MNFKACTFERLAFISLGVGRGAQVGTTSLLEVEFITAQVSTLGVFILSFGTWDLTKVLDLWMKTTNFFYNAKPR